MEDDPTKWTPLDRIRFLLDHWSDIFDPNAAAGMAATGSGDGIPLMPQMSRHPTVVELQRCLSSLALDDPPAHRHLKAFRCNAEWRQVRAKIKFRGPNGREIEGDGWRRERIEPAWISARLVFRAEEYLEQAFRGEVFIPRDLWKGLTEVAGA